MKDKWRIVSVSLSLFVIFVTATPSTAQEHRTVTIIGYTHGACLVDAKKLRPVGADDGHISEYPVSERAYWNCEDRIKAGIIGCERAVTLYYSWQNEKYPGCRKIFESWVPECISHYEEQRKKCKTFQAQTGGNESSDCKFSKRTFAGYQSACDGGDSNACGILSQASAIVEQTCR